MYLLFLGYLDDKSVLVTTALKETLTTHFRVMEGQNPDSIKQISRLEYSN